MRRNAYFRNLNKKRNGYWHYCSNNCLLQIITVLMKGIGMTKNFRFEYIWPWLASGSMLIPMIIDCWNGKWIHLHSHLLFFLGILSLVIFRLLKNEAYAYIKAMGISIIYVFAYFMAGFGGLPTYFKELSALIFGTSNALLLDFSTIFLKTLYIIRTVKWRWKKLRMGFEKFFFFIEKSSFYWRA